MSSTYVQGLIPQVRKILETSDLNKISAKAVRKALIAKGHDEATIKENRDLIDAEIEKIYEELTAQNDAASSSSEEKPLDAVLNPPSSLPQPLRNAQPQRVKTEVKSESKPFIPNTIEETDEEMAARLQREFDSEQSRGRASRSAGTTRPKKKSTTKKRKSKATVDSDGEGGERPKKRAGGGGGAFNKELILSDALTALLGETRLSRPQVVKQIWDYIKANDLQDPSDKRHILCDGPMREVFHVDRLHMFTMNKILVRHLRDPDDVAFKDEPQMHRPAQTAQYIEHTPSIELGDPVPKVEQYNGAPQLYPTVKAEDLIESDDDSED